MSTDDTREALTAMVREGEAAGMYADDHGSAGFCTNHGQPALDFDVIRARAEDFREAIEASSDRVGVRAIKSARDVPDLLAEVERLHTAYREATDDLRAALATAPAAPGVSVSAEQVEAATGVMTERYFARTDETALTSMVEGFRDALTDLGITVTDTPTKGAHLRALPHERYDAVLDSGPTDPDEGADCG